MGVSTMMGYSGIILSAMMDLKEVVLGLVGDYNIRGWWEPKQMNLKIKAVSGQSMGNLVLAVARRLNSLIKAIFSFL
jgi:hypothetical protein